MNIEEWLNYIANQMTKFRPAGAGRFILATSNKQLIIQQSSKLPQDSLLVAYFTSSDINQGVSPTRWNNLGDKILKLIKENKLCPEPPRP